MPAAGAGAAWDILVVTLDLYKLGTAAVVHKTVKEMAEQIQVVAVVKLPAALAEVPVVQGLLLFVIRRLLPQRPQQLDHPVLV